MGRAYRENLSVYVAWVAAGRLWRSAVRDWKASAFAIPFSYLADEETEALDKEVQGIVAVSNIQKVSRECGTSDVGRCLDSLLKHILFWGQT